jgi:peptidoglycan/LPS O-acetylase OafA/YrhL
MMERYYLPHPKTENPKQMIQHSAKDAPPYYPWFDWLRAICAIVVMLYHDKVLTWSQSGNFAVQVFFALSGWLIGGILLKTVVKDLPRFFFNRALRIWVPYYMAAAILLTLSVLREPITAKWVEIVIYKFTFVYNLFGTRQLVEFANAMPQKGTLSHVWSVNAEEQFYLVAPLLLVLGAQYFGKSLLLWIPLAMAGLYFDFYPSIILGVTAALTVQTFGNIHTTKIARKALLGLLLASIPFLTQSAYYAYASPTASICIVLLLAIPGENNFWGKLFGGMSYPLYLNHWIGLFALNFLMPNMHEGLIRGVLVTVFNVVLAMAMYWWVDRQLLAHRNAWFTHQRGLLLTGVAYAIIAVGIAYGFWMLGKN